MGPYNISPSAMPKNKVEIISWLSLGLFTPRLKPIRSNAGSMASMASAISDISTAMRMINSVGPILDGSWEALGLVFTGTLYIGVIYRANITVRVVMFRRVIIPTAANNYKLGEGLCLKNTIPYLLFNYLTIS